MRPRGVSADAGDRRWAGLSAAMSGAAVVRTVTVPVGCVSVARLFFFRCGDAAGVTGSRSGAEVLGCSPLDASGLVAVPGSLPLVAEVPPSWPEVLSSATATPAPASMVAETPAVTRPAPIHADSCCMQSHANRELRQKPRNCQARWLDTEMISPVR
ncbi:hypothetical protein ACXPWS_02670 [Mycobacterium sp. BMJ-28]